MTKRIEFVLVIAVIAASCSSGTAESAASGEVSDPDTAAGELTITAQSDRSLPPWGDFEVEVTPIVLVEQITAVGDPDENGNVPFGSSCNELLANFPDLTGCREEVGDSIFEEGIPEQVGPFETDGTVTIPSPETESNIRVFAVSPADELCAFSGLASFRPGQTDVTVFVEEECS